jgi:glycosyltransferase involved in cell wall biosynthesis
MTTDQQLAPAFLEGKGALDGRTILRFAHAFESGGGTERYLDDLDAALLERNAMTIIRLGLSGDPSSARTTDKSSGRGRLVCIPLPIVPGNESEWGLPDDSLRLRLKQQARDWVLYNPLIWRLAGARWTASLRLTPRPGEAVGAGPAAAESLRSGGIDLVMLHFFGGADADEVFSEARKAGAPIAILNHYSNDRYLHLAIRKHAMMAEGVSGVNGLDVPRYLRHRFVNLSDGIDTEFFRGIHARPPSNPPPRPIVLLPARVVPEKGQMDLVRAVASLRGSGVHCSIVFAGRTDDADYIEKLRAEIARAGLTDCVQFLGNVSVEELRDWYAASAVVAFPTYHHEGLPRVIIEAQAMSVPVIAYATGGVPEGIESGKTGHLLPTGDVTGLAARLREVLSPGSQRESLGARGRELVESRFSLAALAVRHEQFYTQIISDFQAGSGNIPANRKTRAY